MDPYIVYIVAGVLPAFLVFYGRVGKAWAFGAWLLGALTAGLSACAVAFASAPHDGIAQAAIFGEAAPWAIGMPLCGVWLVWYLRRAAAKRAEGKTA